MIDFASGIEDIRAEKLDHLLFYVLFIEQFMGNLIGVDNFTAQFSELGRDGAFTGSDTTQDTYYWFFPMAVHGPGV